jgi:hypothetical protein
MNRDMVDITRELVYLDERIKQLEDLVQRLTTHTHQCPDSMAQSSTPIYYEQED